MLQWVSIPQISISRAVFTDLSLSHMRLTHFGYLRLCAKTRIAGKHKQIAAGSRSIPDINATDRRDRKNFEPVQNFIMNCSLIAVISQLSADNPQETAWIRSIPAI